MIPTLYLPEPDDAVDLEPVEPEAPRYLVRRLLRQTTLIDRITRALWYYHPPSQGRGMRRRRIRRRERR